MPRRREGHRHSRVKPWGRTGGAIRLKQAVSAHRRAAFLFREKALLPVKPALRMSNRLTKAEIDALLIVAGFLLYGEWDEVISEDEAEALRAARIKLQRRYGGK
jgi:hypothetical protein